MTLAVNSSKTSVLWVAPDNFKVMLVPRERSTSLVTSLMLFQILRATAMLKEITNSRKKSRMLRLYFRVR